MDFHFSIFIVAYYKLEFLKESVQSVLDQNYKNYELIIIDNGSVKDVGEYLNTLKGHQNISIYTYLENQFSWEDPLLQIHTCWNKALSLAKGDYIMHLGYDDKISINLLEEYNRILKIEDCLSVAPNLKELNKKGEETNIIKMINDRPEVVDGKKIAMSVIKKDPDIKFFAPGEIFTIKTSFLRTYGGYHRNVEMDTLFGIVAFGKSGFAKNAYIYWRRHGYNLGNELPKKGYSTSLLYKEWLKTKGILSLWSKNFTKKESKEVCKQLINLSIKSDCLNIAQNFYSFNLNGALKLFIKNYKNYFTYLYIFIAFYHRKSVLMNNLKNFIKR